MARLIMHGKGANIAAKMSFTDEMRPSALLNVTGERGQTMQIILEFEEAMQLALGLHKHPAFKTGGKAPKPDPNLEMDLDELSKRIGL